MLRIYNTLTRSIDDFQPLEDKQVKIFVCGPTVYNYIHIGNARTYLSMDLLYRSLQYLGYGVHYLMNITDIDDKILQSARDSGLNWKTDVSDKFRYEFLKDASWLGLEVDKFAAATDYIPQIIDQVQRLLDRGYAYSTSDGVYFEISKFADYGKLSGRTEIKEDDAQTRIDSSDDKRGWNDFCLWKFKASSDDPSWPAAFGEGRPGWHIEDTAITETEYGPQYDVHGGAIDLIFPHHEAELTQMESLSGLSPFVKYWVHGGFVTVNDKRMGKSNLNFTTVRDLKDQGYTPEELKLLVYQSHYRSPLNFSEDLLAATRQRLRRWRQLVDRRWQTDKATDWPDETQPKQILDKMTASLEDDLNTPRLLADFESILGLIEKHSIKDQFVPTFNDILQLINQVLGINLLNQDIADNHKLILEERDKARKASDWAKSDQLRDKLADNGITVLDTQDGQIWHHSQPDS